GGVGGRGGGRRRGGRGGGKGGGRGRWGWRRGRRGCRGHGGRCRRAGRCRDGLLFLRNQLFRRCHRPQGYVNRVGREPRGSGGAIGLRTHRHGLRLIAAERKRHRELAAGLHRN